MMRDAVMALVLLAMAGQPFGAAAATQGLIAVCSQSGVRWVGRDGNRAPAPAMPDFAGCAHMICPGRERKPV